MFDRSAASGLRENGNTCLDLEERLRRVVDYSNRVDLLVGVEAPNSLVRKEEQLLTAAVICLFEDPDVRAITSHMGIQECCKYLSYVTGIEIEPPWFEGIEIAAQ